MAVAETRSDQRQITLVNVWKRLQPSTSAASSSSFGTLLMKPRSVHTV
jgi:hypothetical protein